TRELRAAVEVGQSAEDQLAASNRRFVQAFDVSPVPLAITAAETGVYLETNVAWLKALGFSRDEVIGKNSIDLNLWANREERQQVWDAIASGVRLRDLEVRLRRKDGAIAHTLLSYDLISRPDGAPQVLWSGYDITDRVRAEQAVQESESRFRDFAETASDWFWEMDADLRFAYFSEKAEEGLKRDPAALIGQTRWDITDEIVHDEKWQAHRADLESHRAFNGFEYGIIVGGSPEYISVSGKPVFDEKGIFVGYRGTGRNVTARRNIEEGLRRSRQTLEEAQRIGHIGSWEYDAEEDLLTWSNEVRRIFGLEGETLAADYKTFINMIHPDEREGVHEQMCSLSMDNPFQIEYRIVRPDGSMRWLHERAEAVEEKDGKTTRTRGTVQDVTERRLAEDRIRESEKAATQAQERLLDAITALPGGFALFDADDRLVLCNEVYRRMYGTHDDVVSVGSTLEEMLRKGLEYGDYAAAKGREEEWLSERMAQHFNPKELITQELSDGRWLQIFERKTREGGIVGMRIDITDLKKREAELGKALLEADIANRAKTEFLATMSHELRTPLNAVIGFSDILSKEMFGPMGVEEYKNYAGDINESGRHLLELINDILDVSRIEIGTLELMERKVDVRQMVASCRRQVTDQARKAELDIKVEIPDTLPAFYADERRIKQVLINLLTNAIKFTGIGGLVTLTADLDDGGGYRFAVSDTGIGIRPEDIEKVLSKFGQADTSLTRRFEGAGLGLPLSKNLVELHDGTLTLESVVGQGTTITLSFPPARTLEGKK
ncbi:MAG: PAS domain S-box protein, partial [Rhodospirillales bacterium]|nr:PAS domain S-box protein [Rhodospirillales bacterium]